MPIGTTIKASFFCWCREYKIHNPDDLITDRPVCLIYYYTSFHDKFICQMSCFSEIWSKVKSIFEKETNLYIDSFLLRMFMPAIH